MHTRVSGSAAQYRRLRIGQGIKTLWRCRSIRRVGPNLGTSMASTMAPIASYGSSYGHLWHLLHAAIIKPSTFIEVSTATIAPMATLTCMALVVTYGFIGSILCHLCHLWHYRSYGTLWIFSRPVSNTQQLNFTRFQVPVET